LINREWNAETEVDFVSIVEEVIYCSDYLNYFSCFIHWSFTHSFF